MKDKRYYTQTSDTYGTDGGPFSETVFLDTLLEYHTRKEIEITDEEISVNGKIIATRAIL